MIKRRVLVGLGACGWMPFASRGQAPTGNYILGYLGQGSKARMREPTHDLAVVLAHLKEQGFVEGRNLSVEARFAEGRFEDLSRLAHQLVQTKPQVIVVQNGGQAEAVVRQTKTVPVVALTAGLLEGLPNVKSLAKPGGNLTGMQMHSPGLIGKRLQLLYEAVPGLRRVVVLRAGRSAGGYALYHEATDAAAAKLNIRVRYVRFSNLAELEQRFEEMPRQQDQAVLVWNDPYLSLHRAKIAQRLLRLGLPALYDVRSADSPNEFMVYAAKRADVLREAVGYVDKILKGAKPADLPIGQAKTIATIAAVAG